MAVNDTNKSIQNLSHTYQNQSNSQNYIPTKTLKSPINQTHFSLKSKTLSTI